MSQTDAIHRTAAVDRQRETLFALSKDCGAAAENFASAAAEAKDFELRAFLTNCSRNRNIMADHFFELATSLVCEASASNVDKSPATLNLLKTTLATGSDLAILAACRASEETLIESVRVALEMPLSPEPDAVVRKHFSDVVATCERIRSLEQTLQSLPIS